LLKPEFKESRIEKAVAELTEICQSRQSTPKRERVIRPITPIEKLASKSNSFIEDSFKSLKAPSHDSKEPDAPPKSPFMLKKLRGADLSKLSSHAEFPLFSANSNEDSWQRRMELPGSQHRSNITDFTLPVDTVGNIEQNKSLIQVLDMKMSSA
jgi:hypothetical protein